MATRNVFGAHAILALKDQAKRFEMMSVHLAKSPKLAIMQADEIVKWGLKLIDAINKIQRDTKAAAIMHQQHQHQHSKIHELQTKADSRKRIILGTQELGSSRTIRANLRLIFGPARETEYRSKSTKYLISTTTERINIIRDLCNEYPDSIIALSIGYPTKTWTEPVPEIFEAIIAQLKQEQSEEWPEEILDIMNELRDERPMSPEFETLRGRLQNSSYHSKTVVKWWSSSDKRTVKISERHGHYRRRMKEPIQASADAGQPVPATNGIDAAHPTAQASFPISGC